MKRAEEWIAKFFNRESGYIRTKREEEIDAHYASVINQIRAEALREAARMIVEYPDTDTPVSDFSVMLRVKADDVERSL